MLILGSCSKDEFKTVDNITSSKKGFQVIGAVQDFDKKIVGTRSDDIADSHISEMTMFIFDKNGDIVQGYSGTPATEQNKCSSAINIQKGNPTFMVDTEDGVIASLDGDNSKIIHYDNNNTNLSNCRIYIVANLWHQLENSLDDINSISDLEAFKVEIDNTLDMPKKDDGHYRGFPMIGTHLSNVSFDLTKTGSNSNSVATIPLKKLFSKIRFTMQVNADQVVAGQTPKFQIKNVEVFNVPNKAILGRTVDANNKPVYGTTASDDYVTEVVKNNNITDFYHYINTGMDSEPFVISNFNKSTIYHSTSATTDDIIEFGFYIPEHKITPYSINYPNNIEINDKQKYKPLGVVSHNNGDGTTSSAKIATFIRIHGIYTDHNGQIKQVSYDIYLGQNNTDDFTIKRNQLLNNKLVITGLTNYKDAYPDVEGNISIDHRVDIEDKGFNLSMERTAILDSHFEVRPLDIELQPGSSITIVIPDDCKNWIALESDAAAKGGSADIYVNTTDPRKGVRKYFTTNLVSELYTDNKGICTINHSNPSSGKTEIHRVWFYVDENLDVYDKTGATTPANGYTVSTTQYRVGKVKFFYSSDSTPDTSKEPDATVNFQQWNLWRVWSADGNRYYDIEHEEEYLNNYASDQQYGQTQDGITWGLDGIQLSNKQQAAYVKEDNGGILAWVLNTFSNGFTEWVNTMITNSGISPFYDFYLNRDNPYASITPRDYQGLNFNKEIATTLLKNNSGNINAKINGVMLTEDPNSAFSYCYNKNKRNTNGDICYSYKDGDEVKYNTDNLKWHLPSIDEIEDIASGAYDEFDRVFQSKEYWSCQPAYTKNLIAVDVSLFLFINGSTTGSYYEDDVNRARATKIVFNENSMKYENISSSVDGNTKKLSIKNKSWNESELVYSPPTPTGETIVYHEGNNSRTGEKCRIRAVYRSGTK